MSAIIALGKFRGGQLRHWENESGANNGTANVLLGEDVAKHSLHLRLQISDGQRAETAPFGGHSSTFIW